MTYLPRVTTFTKVIEINETSSVQMPPPPTPTLLLSLVKYSFPQYGIREKFEQLPVL